MLEIGAGSGYYSLEVARRVSEGQLVLLDLQPEMLKKAQKKIDEERLSNIGFTLADASNLPFKEHSFDVIFLITVLGEIANQENFLTEALRVLKPDGILSISEHLPDPDFSPFVKVKSLVQKEGFKLFKQYGVKWSYTANFRKPKVTIS